MCQKKHFVVFIERTIPGHHDSDTVDDMLNCTFVANEILRNRRLDARDLVCLSAAYASRVIQDHPELAKAKIAKKNDETSRLRRRLMYISKCTAGVCGFTPAELRKNYNGLKNPVSADFYSEVITRAEAWTEQQNEAIDINQAAILLRLDETIDDLKADIAAYDFIKAAEAHKADKVPVGIGYANNAG
ncbi:MAG: hypothetical protein Q4E47_00045 [Candidatus Saccharibacteria bacterium]|nr:hypothetical protein [Candidatus Saccharibacteria bacterium]